MDEIATLVRATRRAQQLPYRARCAICGERSVWTLVKNGRRVLCYECSVRQREQHHITGRNNADLSVSIPANMHRTLSDYQQDWPDGVLGNPSGGPTVVREAVNRSRADIIRLATVRQMEHDDPAYNALLDGIRRLHEMLESAS